MSQEKWEARYVDGDLPWDTADPDPHLTASAFVDGGLAPETVLEIGCGTGTNALWLAARGARVVGIDISPSAIAAANDKAANAAGDCRFEAIDFFVEDIAGAPFELVFDRGCFHVFDEAEQQSKFAQRVADHLAPGGLWLSLIGSTEGPERDHGPPRRSARDLTAALEPVLEIIEMRGIEYYANIPSPARAWFCLSRKRQIPAQPSTVRSLPQR